MTFSPCLSNNNPRHCSLSLKFVLMPRLKEIIESFGEAGPFQEISGNVINSFSLITLITYKFLNRNFHILKDTLNHQAKPRTSGSVPFEGVSKPPCQLQKLAIWSLSKTFTPFIFLSNTHLFTFVRRRRKVRLAS